MEVPPRRILQGEWEAGIKMIAAAKAQEELVKILKATLETPQED